MYRVFIYRITLSCLQCIIMYYSVNVLSAVRPKRECNPMTRSQADEHGNSIWIEIVNSQNLIKRRGGKQDQNRFKNTHVYSLPWKSEDQFECDVHEVLLPSVSVWVTPCNTASASVHINLGSEWELSYCGSKSTVLCFKALSCEEQYHYIYMFYS